MLQHHEYLHDVQAESQASPQAACQSGFQSAPHIDQLVSKVNLHSCDFFFDSFKLAFDDADLTFDEVHLAFNHADPAVNEANLFLYFADFLQSVRVTFESDRGRSGFNPFASASSAAKSCAGMM